MVTKSLSALAFLVLVPQVHAFMSHEEIVSSLYARKFATHEKFRMKKVLPRASLAATTEAPRSTFLHSVPSQQLSNQFAGLGIADGVDLRKYDSPVVSQFGGTCSTFGTAAVMNNALKQKGINDNVSEEYLWDLYQRYSIDAAVDTATSNYLVPEQYWPINGSPTSDYQSHASLKITGTINHDGDMAKALQALNQNHPVDMAIQVPKDMNNCNETVNAYSNRTKGQHVVAAVGYKLDPSVAGGGYFIIKNSWGSGCGDHGYQYYPFHLCERSDLYCYFIEVTGVEKRN